MPRYKKIKSSLLILSLGATVSNRDGKIDSDAISSMVRQIKNLNSLSGDRRLQVIAVVGAGGLGREYVHFAQTHGGGLNEKNSKFDLIGIQASRVNALLFASALANASVLTNAKVPASLKELDHYLSAEFEAVVLGGLEPGMTSDSTAATIAQTHSRSPLIIVSTVGGIFENDTKRKTNNQTLPLVNRSYLQGIIATKPREHVLDTATCKILLDKKSAGMSAAVTGYPHIFEVAKKLISRGTKGKAKEIKQATVIVI